jgi:hypothetical protein
MDLEDITYSRDVAIAAVTDYYTFLTRMYMKDSHVVYPRPGAGPLSSTPTPPCCKP